MERNPTRQRRRGRLGELTIQVETCAVDYEAAPPPGPVQEVSFKFRVQVKCFHFHVAQDNTVTSLHRHKMRLLPFKVSHFPIHVLEGVDNEALRLCLSPQFQHCPSICANRVADAIKHKWNQIRQNDYSTVYGKVLPFTITLKLMNYVTILQEEPGVNEYGMVPTRKSAIETMLKRVKFEEIKDDSSSCVICFEDFTGKERSIVKMPCLHVFHKHCINKWLEISHYCPTCRFQMPTL